MTEEPREAKLERSVVALYELADNSIGVAVKTMGDDTRIVPALLRRLAALTPPEGL